MKREESSGKSGAYFLAICLCLPCWTEKYQKEIAHGAMLSTANTQQQSDIKHQANHFRRNQEANQCYTLMENFVSVTNTHTYTWRPKQRLEVSVDSSFSSLSCAVILHLLTLSRRRVKVLNEVHTSPTHCDNIQSPTACYPSLFLFLSAHGPCPCG